MKVICAWCGEIKQDGCGPVSHGICEKCAKALTEDIPMVWDYEMDQFHGEWYVVRFTMDAGQVGGWHSEHIPPHVDDYEILLWSEDGDVEVDLPRDLVERILAAAATHVMCERSRV
jgi:hypothetical protein